jgi:hypothetical protein
MALVHELVKLAFLNGKMRAVCLKCKTEIITENYFNDEMSFKQRCKCGCYLYKYNSATETAVPYFTRAFIPAKYYKHGYEHKDKFERLGFEKKETKEGTKYIKG